MNQEIERKFRLTKEQADEFLKRYSNKLSASFEIAQFYLVNKERQRLTVGVDGWEVSVNDVKIMIPLLDGEIAKINELKLSEEGNLIDLPESSCRFRFKWDIETKEIKKIFTFKIDSEGKLFEFEYEISDDEKTDIESLCSEINSKISKVRQVYSVDSLNYELDLFHNLDIIIVEIEFKCQDDANNFVPDFEYDYEATNVKSLSNLQLSLIIENAIESKQS
ncbi:hypothetical protein AKG60_21745 [Vibrio parahaemolyticus]|uniref:CYTH domain-containing protein n=1 Tax=Vibrio parahaemolyticus TaxID=670 RepID=A0AAX0M639_VIBPH|nr:hypothetical protein [Vibrio vulnificus]EGQ8302055.1 hypothetical protein [Vibrio parahaemolyticus]MCS0327180.1 hypothetical protein [Vibrio diabolicus]ARN70096.1 hypothetical protein FORC36_5579 [Vibrio vulnificus]EGQ8891821.1 hypothetical protein [Vibrio parahaemolyticus]EGR2221587.1 hypothetical protein [Vibrio parahaemolyticus]